MQLSVAVAVPVLAGRVLAVQVIVTFGGHAIPGRVASDILMVWIHVAVCPHTSVIVHVRVTTIGHVPVATSM